MCVQAELDTLLAQNDKTEAKASAMAKQVSTLEAQLSDAQEAIQDETRQKLAALSKLKQAEELAANAKEQAEEEEASRKAIEAKLASLSAQV